MNGRERAENVVSVLIKELVEHEVKETVGKHRI